MSRNMIGTSIGVLFGAGIAWKNITALQLNAAQAIFIGAAWVISAAYAGHAFSETP